MHEIQFNRRVQAQLERRGRGGGELREGARVVWRGGGGQTAADREAYSLGRSSERGRRKRSGNTGEAAEAD
uniref:Uncharacterized protein n=1 Tax=Setaria italica TaxID=4555 RepID=A0A341KMC2_SETIT